MNFAERIAEKIKKEKIKPLSPWYFSAKNWIFWISFFLSLLLGSVAFSFLLIALIQNEFVPAMMILPFLWIGTLAILITSAWYFVWHTKTGYRIPSWIWIGGNVGVSMILGALLYFSTFDHWQDQMMRFSGMKNAQEVFWSRPEEGFLSGTLALENEDIILIDKMHQKWYLRFSEKVQKKHPLLLKQLSVSKRQEIFLPPHPVKIQGVIVAKDMFLVEDMKPLMRGKMREEKMQFIPVPSAKLHLLPSNTPLSPL